MSCTIDDAGRLAHASPCVPGCPEAPQTRAWPGGLPVDHPDADPVADLRRYVERLRREASKEHDC